MKRSISSSNVDLVGRLKKSIEDDKREAPTANATPYFDVFTAFSFVLPLSTLNKEKPAVREAILEGVIDKPLQRRLEVEEGLINWDRSCIHLSAIKTLGDGNCLMHAASLAMWGLHDRNLILRSIVYEALAGARSTGLFDRWQNDRRTELRQLDASMEVHQWQAEYQQLVDMVNPKNGTGRMESLTDFHIFVLCNILRRPIIVYGTVRVSSLSTGASFAPNNIPGVYLPLMWNHDSVSKDPITLGYMGSHFSALVPSDQQVGSLPPAVPLCNHNGQLLPIKFMLPTEVHYTETFMREYMTVSKTRSSAKPVLTALLNVKDQPNVISRLWVAHVEHCKKEEESPVPAPRRASNPHHAPSSDTAERSSKCLQCNSPGANADTHYLCRECYQGQLKVMGGGSSSRHDPPPTHGANHQLPGGNPDSLPSPMTTQLQLEQNLYQGSYPHQGCPRQESNHRDGELGKPSVQDKLCALTSGCSNLHQGIEGCDTPAKLADLLKCHGVSEIAAERLKEEEISGKEFFALREDDLEKMNLKIGQIKKILNIQTKYYYQPQMTSSSVIPPQGPESKSHLFFTGQHSTSDVQGPMAVLMPVASMDSEVAISPAKEVLEFCKEIKTEPGLPQVYRLPKKQRSSVDKDVILCDVGMKIESDVLEQHKLNKIVMMVGATGAGKTTLINGMANYLFGIEWRDKFRFQLIADEDEGGKDQTTSKTKHISAYHFPHRQNSRVIFSLTIIDTPGFGDTGGLQEDKRIFEQVRQLFTQVNDIDHLDGIGFVAQASFARLTPTQQYIFDSILSIFGKDIGENIFLMTTFCDGQRPPVIDAVIKAKILYQDTAFKFNNSALFVSNTANPDNEEDNFNGMFWNMGMTSFQRFFNHLAHVEPKSLCQTREVLKERKTLQNLVKGLQPQIRMGLTKMDQFRQEEIMVTRQEAEISSAKNFTYKVKVQKQKAIPLTGVCTTNCLQCGFTCHNGCVYKNNKDKERCIAMENGNCKVCPKQCHWKEHHNTPFSYEWHEEEVTKTSEELLKRYNIAKDEKANVERVMENLQEDLKRTRQVVLQMVNKTKQCLQRLSEIALRTNPLTDVQYIDTLIQSEEHQSQPGFLKRVEALKEVRREAEILSGMSDADVQAYMEADNQTFFENLIPEAGQGNKGWLPWVNGLIPSVDISLIYDQAIDKNWTKKK